MSGWADSMGNAIDQMNEGPKANIDQPRHVEAAQEAADEALCGSPAEADAQGHNQELLSKAVTASLRNGKDLHSYSKAEMKALQSALIEQGANIKADGRLWPKTQAAFDAYSHGRLSNVETRAKVDTFAGTVDKKPLERGAMTASASSEQVADLDGGGYQPTQAEIDESNRLQGGGHLNMTTTQPTYWTSPTEGTRPAARQHPWEAQQGNVRTYRTPGGGFVQEATNR